MALQPVPASSVCSCCSSSCPASSSRRLRATALSMRLRVTGVKLIDSATARSACAQRVHDWITASDTSPVGRMPSSKKRCRARPMRCGAVLKNTLGATALAAIVDARYRVGCRAMVQRQRSPWIVLKRDSSALGKVPDWGVPRTSVKVALRRFACAGAAMRIHQRRRDACNDEARRLACRPVGTGAGAGHGAGMVADRQQDDARSSFAPPPPRSTARPSSPTNAPRATGRATAWTMPRRASRS